jgi:hypothetical protein
MSIESDIVTALRAMSAVTALVGTSSSARIDVDVFGEKTTYPAILLEVDTEEPANSLDGKGGLVFADVTLTCRATTRLASRALAEAVRLNGTSPGTGLAGYSASAFDAVLTDSQTAVVPYDEGSDRHYYDTVQTYLVSWTEST